MNCFAGESSQTRRINRQSKCQGTFLNLWANAHLWWLQAPLWKILSKNTKERSALHHLWSSESSLCVWAVGGGMYWGGMYWGGNNDLKRWPPVLRIYHKGNLHLLKRHLDRVTYLGVNLRSLERAAHFPHWRSYTEKSTHGSGEMRKHNWWFQARHPIFIFVIAQFSIQVYTDFFLSLK